MCGETCIPRDSYVCGKHDTRGQKHDISLQQWYLRYSKFTAKIIVSFHKLIATYTPYIARVSIGRNELCPNIKRDPKEVSGLQDTEALNYIA